MKKLLRPFRGDGNFVIDAFSIKLNLLNFWFLSWGFFFRGEQTSDSHIYRRLHCAQEQTGGIGTRIGSHYIVAIAT